VSAVVVVANPAAGGGRGRRLVPDVLVGLRSLGLDHSLVVTRDASHPTLAAADAAEAGARAVVAVGGDGLVGACAAGIVGTDTVLAVVPAGTGNDFARNLGLHGRTPLRALRLLAEGITRRVDVGTAEGTGWENQFVCVAGAGFDSETNELANRTTGPGTARYAAAVLRTLATFRPARFTVGVDGREHGGRAMMVAVGNAASYGGGMRICPQASLDDGLLEVCVVGALSKPEFVATFPRVYRGTHVHHPSVRMYRGSQIELRADRPFRVYGDGEPMGHLPATFTVQRGALVVAAP
jgi:diacylglycerol kinase (ATP)